MHVGGDIRLEGTVAEYFLFGPNGVTEGAVGYAHGTGTMYFETNQTTSMVIDGSGRVGIGVVAPDAALVASGYITQIHPNGGIRTFGLGSQSAPNYECVDFFHNGVVAGIRTGAYGSGVYRDFIITCGGAAAFPATPGITLQFNGGYVLQARPQCYL